MTKYSLDSSALIQAWLNWYTMATHPPVWELLERLGEEGLILVAQPVFTELAGTRRGEKDPLYKWLKDREDLFLVGIDERVMAEFERLQDVHEGFGETHVPTTQRGKHYADPFVVAVASVHGAVVISHEEENKGRQKTGRHRPPTITTVCLREEIQCSKFYRIIKDSGIVLQKAN